MIDDSFKRIIRRTLDGYERGIFTSFEACNQIFDVLDLDNAKNVLENLPKEFVSRLREMADSAPHSEDDWDKLKLYYIGSALYLPGHEPKPMSDEERFRHDEANKKAYRITIELIRNHLTQELGKAVP